MSKINPRWEEVEPGRRWEMKGDGYTEAEIWRDDVDVNLYRWEATGLIGPRLQNDAASLEAAQLAAQDYIRQSMSGEVRLFDGDKGQSSPPPPDRDPGVT